MTIVALLRDLDASPGARPSSEAEAVDIALRRPYEVYDVRAQRGLGFTARLKIEVRSVAPVVLALSEHRLPEFSIAGPPGVRVGETADLRIAVNGAPIAALDVFHIEVADPDSNIVPYYGSNLLAPAGAASYSLPLAVNDKAGEWTIWATDLLTGGTATVNLQVKP